MDHTLTDDIPKTPPRKKFGRDEGIGLNIFIFITID